MFLFGFNSTLFSPCSLDRDESVTFLVIVFHPLSTRTRAPPSTRPRAPSRAPRLVHLRLRRALSQHGLQKRRLLRHRRRSRPRLHPHAFRAVSIRVVANRSLPKPTSERVRVHSRGRRIPTVAESPRERRARRLDAHPRTIPRRAKVTRGGPERARLRRGEPARGTCVVGRVARVSACTAFAAAEMARDADRASVSPSVSASEFEVESEAASPSRDGGSCAAGKSSDARVADDSSADARSAEARSAGASTSARAFASISAASDSRRARAARARARASAASARDAATASARARFSSSPRGSRNLPADSRPVRVFRNGTTRRA